MRSLELNAALTEHIQAVADLLQAEIVAGAEVPFELEQSRGRTRGGPSLYSYRPLTEQFIAERKASLERLPSFEPAARLLDCFDGLQGYLATAGMDGAGDEERVRIALGVLLGDVFGEQTDFKLQADRVQQALARLERAALHSTSEFTLVGTLHGLTITSPELALTRGLTIAQPHALEGLPGGAITATGAEDDGVHLVVVLCTDNRRGALSQGREVLTDLQRALRLFGDGRVTLGLLGWARSGGGAWSPVPLGAGGRPHGMLVVSAEQEDELRAFCNLVSRRSPHQNELAWALRRFELASERESVFDALTDHLLALRALLEPEGPSSGLLGWRVAALCSTPEHREALVERVNQALALERAVITGTAIDPSGARGLGADMAAYLRALLRDVICGHLDLDLVKLADELLLAGAPEPDVPANGSDLDAALAPEAQQILSELFA